MQRSHSRDLSRRLGGWNASVLALVLVGPLSAVVALSEQPGAIGFQPSSVSFAGVLVVLGGMVGCAIAGGAADVSGRGETLVRFLALSTVLFGACAIAFAIGVAIVAVVAWLASGAAPDTAASASLPWLLVRVWWGITTLSAMGYAAAVATGRRMAGIAFIVALVIAEQLLAIASPDTARLAPISAAAAVARGSAASAVVVATAIYLAAALAIATRLVEAPASQPVDRS